MKKLHSCFELREDDRSKIEIDEQITCAALAIAEENKDCAVPSVKIGDLYVRSCAHKDSPSSWPTSDKHEASIMGELLEKVNGSLENYYNPLPLLVISFRGGNSFERGEAGSGL